MVEFKGKFKKKKKKRLINSVCQELLRLVRTSSPSKPAQESLIDKER